jgi:protein-S-isoprenylcysteine O-methyltransferase Ste14
MGKDLLPVGLRDLQPNERFMQARASPPSTPLIADRRPWGSRGTGGPEKTPYTLGILALSFVVGLKLNSVFVGSGFGHASPSRYPVIAFLAMVGLAVVGSTVAIHGRLRRIGGDPVDLVRLRLGPYGLSRNPMSLGLMVFYCAMAVAADAPLACAVLPAAFLLVEMFVVIPNERRLRRQIGPSYDSYRRDVPQWI